MTDRPEGAVEGSMAGKTCLVTGATSGIGEVAARQLARLGATVLIVGRSPERCAATVAAIRQETGNAAVEAVTADLSSQAELRRLTDEVRQRHGRLHVLLNNAGALFASRRESADGIEMTLALNHLGPFLLTNLLLNELKAGAPSRVVTVSSHAHEMVSGFDFDDPQARKGSYKDSPGTLYALLAPTMHPGFRQYARSKLANLLFTFELARRLEGTGVAANALHPGFVQSRFMEGNGPLGWFMRRWVSLLGISVEEGAKTLVHLSSSPEVEGVSGKYFVKSKQARPSRAAADEAAARRLWQLSEELVGGRQTLTRPS
jgi:NAD(P)-dependent dehydrogenase (short-subunit alcohol dehydrogenase family)